WTVDRGNRDIEQAEVYGQLPAMMVPVVQHDAPVERNLWHLEERRAVHLSMPLTLQAVVTELHRHIFGFGYALSVSGHDFVGRFRRLWPAAAGEVHLVSDGPG